MSPLLPVAVYGLEVPAGDIPMPAVTNFPATFRITMAAIDPTAPPQLDAVRGNPPPRATLKLIREPFEAGDEESDDDDDIDAIRARLGDAISDEEDDEEDDDGDEKNGGPSDPAKSKKARKEAAVKALLEAINAEDDMEVDDVQNGVNGTKVNKGKGKAVYLDEDDEDDDDESDLEIEEFVICTLDPEKNYQQPLDITIGEDERVYFKVTGTHNIYLTGNYVIPPDDQNEDDYSDEEDMDYDLSPDEDELDDEYDEDEEEDMLDGLEDPRITELESDEEAPKLVKVNKKKGKKRPADESDDEEAATLDSLIKQASDAAPASEKASKKQAKKLKSNAGQAVPAAEGSSKKESEKQAAKSDKKVQFAKNLEQGPTGSPKTEVKPSKKEEKAKTGPKVVQGVTVDDRKVGDGRPAKRGDRIGMRYIGKLEKDGKVFDSNKKGPPFSFKLGIGEVIKGWDIGVAGMCVGGERRITIPASLAYGSKSLPGIPSNSTLVFDIKMIKLN